MNSAQNNNTPRISLQQAKQPQIPLHQILNQKLQEKRENFATEIRRNKREDTLKKQRQIKFNSEQKPLQITISDFNCTDIQSQSEVIDKELENYLGLSNLDVLILQKLSIETKKQIIDIQAESQYLQQGINKFLSTSLENKYVGLIQIRKILGFSTDISYQINHVYQQGLFPILKETLEKSNCLLMLREAGWVVTNLLSGEENYVQEFIRLGILDTFMNVFDRITNVEILDQIFHCIGNISGTNYKFRNQILEKGIADKLIDLMPKILSKYKNNDKHSYISDIVWAISNLIRGKPLPQHDLYFSPKIINIFFQYLNECQYLKTESKQEILWGLRAISTDVEDLAKPLIEPENFRTLVNIYNKYQNKPSFAEPIIGIIANLAYFSDEIEHFLMQQKWDKHRSNKQFNLPEKYVLLQLQNYNLEKQINELQYHCNEAVYNKAFEILKDFFDKSDTDNSETDSQVEESLSSLSSITHIQNIEINDQTQEQI
ncbi:Armadillo-type fold [Pseudocohnilembus persalinus]|uniref:Armadillo-type fold n=1 Tax=Pseudocohnilembus persalinus TaxID=266149 RepID=A0A0V0QX83_PSEPJ|nr:Armadillo-type fold [Pseudocohnilembus persalinus]|eukprot:KRX06624.1 Armadillo-type fold [Pseudocohnilembus persalinus]